MPRTPKKVSELRIAREEMGLTQRQVAERTGIPLVTYRRLERGEIKNPGIRLLVNCSYVLEVPIWEVLSLDWLKWTPFNGAKAPKTKEDFSTDF